MPPHWEHAGPRSRPTSLAGSTGGLSVIASAAPRVVPGAEALIVDPPLPGFDAAPAVRAGAGALAPPPAVAGLRRRAGRVAARCRVLGRAAGAHLLGEDAQVLL